MSPFFMIIDDVLTLRPPLPVNPREMMNVESCLTVQYNTMFISSFGGKIRGIMVKVCDQNP